MLQRNGRGFGFRGSSPPWPYTGRGRGGLPRCQYPGLSRSAGGYAAPAAAQDELAVLKAQAAGMQQQLGEIERRIQELEKQN